MKTTNISINSNLPRRRLISYLLATAVLAMMTITTSPWLGRAYGGGFQDQRDEKRRVAEFLLATYNQAQEAQLLDLAANFHAALSYNGDSATKSAHLTAMSNLWVTASSLTFSNTLTSVTASYSGKDEVMGFLATGGYFLNNWVSLAPEYKTEVTVHGDRAHISTQCVAVDLGVTPNVVKAVIQVEADAVRHGDKWLFVAMYNSSPAPL